MTVPQITGGTIIISVRRKVRFSAAIINCMKVLASTQRMLPALGAFSVRPDVSCPYGNALLFSLDKAYGKVIAPDPFLYYVHKTKLLEEATLALAGDRAAKNSFFQRLAIVIEAGT